MKLFKRIPHKTAVPVGKKAWQYVCCISLLGMFWVITRNFAKVELPVNYIFLGFYSLVLQWNKKPNLKVVATKRAQLKLNSDNVTVDPLPYDRKKDNV